ncbi:glutathione S-transferase family protein [Acinetobacter sp. ANC 5414]|uniref:glutathione S-transferase family protein n=1 Tax=Acinetobacter sp. ANC 5414 TaxID=2731251 RepID=UPI00148F7286|nr:glutathione S-transferase family protein [Acinetobacter sp. ANC 5414]NNH00983.1 glutathione S-transferase family protein [Acinetobacter sp. ANC 5414]
MKLYNNTQSRGMTVMLLVKELGIEDQIEEINVPYENMHQAEYLKINPMGKVPCLIDQGVMISEVAAIFTYLADKCIEKGLAPPLDDPKRGAYLKWMFFTHGPLTEFMDLKGLNVPDEQIEQRKRSLTFGHEESVLAFLKKGMQEANPYLLGEKISAADLFLGYWVIFAIYLKILPYLDEFKPFIQLLAQRDSMKGVPWLHKIND